MPEPEQDASPEIRTSNAERMKFFTDAVVAIAMTLLILPLLESIQEAARDGSTTRAFVNDHGGQLFSSVLSFVIIASFWVGHERLFDYVGQWTGRLMLLNVAWMLTIVFLPIATAMVGSMETDALQKVLYIGSMLVSSLLMAAMNVVVRATPSTWEGGAGPSTGGLSASLGLATLFGLALLLSLVVPGLDYLPMFLLALTGPVQSLFERVRGRDSTRRVSRPRPARR